MELLFDPDVEGAGGVDGRLRATPLDSTRTSRGAIRRFARFRPRHRAKTHDRLGEPNRANKRKPGGPNPPGSSGPRSPLYYYVPGLSVLPGGLTLPATGTGRQARAWRVATVGPSGPAAEWAIRRMG
jgi:hypothetical protein